MAIFRQALANCFILTHLGWANDPTFPPQKNVTPGFDPIVGQAGGKPRETLDSTTRPNLKLPRDFVLSRGGEYFFSPSIKALKTTFSS